MKKLLILSFCAVILLSVVSGSIAFFTDSVQTDNNVIVSGSIDIAQSEYEREKGEDGSYTGKLQPYSQDQTIHPCVITGEAQREEFDVDGHKVELYVSGMNNFVDKIVTVKNEGDNAASVRTFVAVPATSDGVSWIHLDKNTQGGWVWHDMVSDENAAEGSTEGTTEGSTEGSTEGAAEDPIEDIIIPGQEIDGKFYNIHVATYTPALAPGATTAPSLLGFYLDSRITNQNGSYIFTDDAGKTHNLGSEAEMSILVATEATQAIGFVGNETELNKLFKNAYDALDTVFGAPDKHHPWMPTPAPENPAP